MFDVTAHDARCDPYYPDRPKRQQQQQQDLLRPPHRRLYLSASLPESTRRAMLKCHINVLVSVVAMLFSQVSITPTLCCLFLTSGSQRRLPPVSALLPPSPSPRPGSFQKNGGTDGRTTSMAAATTRAVFLASLVLSSTTVGGLTILDPQECQARETEDTKTRSKSRVGNSPRYIDRELSMIYGQNKDGTPLQRKTLVRRITGDSTPYSFPVKKVVLTKKWPETPPFIAQDFFRVDNNDDPLFYKVPKLVYHIDEPAVAALTQYYRKNIRPGSRILDICSSWVSHYPMEFPSTMKRICATGISEMELQYNDQVTNGCYQQADLNVEPVRLNYPDNSFDVVTCVVSIDYLLHPIEVLREVHRVLRPGGQVIVSQSNRCFPTKAIALWLRLSDHDHLELINGFFQYAGGYQLPCEAYDITATVPGQPFHDPMFIVKATKK